MSTNPPSFVRTLAEPIVSAQCSTVLSHAVCQPCSSAICLLERQHYPTRVRSSLFPLSKYCFAAVGVHAASLRPPLRPSVVGSPQRRPCTSQHCRCLNRLDTARKIARLCIAVLFISLGAYVPALLIVAVSSQLSVLVHNGIVCLEERGGERKRNKYPPQHMWCAFFFDSRPLRL